MAVDYNQSERNNSDRKIYIYLKVFSWQVFGVICFRCNFFSSKTSHKNVEMKCQYFEDSLYDFWLDNFPLPVCSKAIHWHRDISAVIVLLNLWKLWLWTILLCFIRPPRSSNPPSHTAHLNSWYWSVILWWSSKLLPILIYWSHLLKSLKLSRWYLKKFHTSLLTWIISLIHSCLPWIQKFFPFEISQSCKSINICLIAIFCTSETVNKTFSCLWNPWLPNLCLWKPRLH